MKTFIADIFPKLLQFSKKLDNTTILVNHPWLAYTEDSSERKIFIFSSSKELILSTNGIVQKGRWEYFQSANSILIEIGETKTLFNKAFIDESILLLKQDGNDEMLIFANENKLRNPINIQKYIEKEYQQKIRKEALQIKEKKYREIQRSPKELLYENVFAIKDDIFLYKVVTYISVLASISTIVYGFFNPWAFILSVVLLIFAVFMWMKLSDAKFQLYKAKRQYTDLQKKDNQ